MQNDINLLKNELESSGVFSSAQKMASLYIVVGIIGLEILLYAGLGIYAANVKKQQLAADTEAAEVDKSINLTKQDLADAIRYQQRLANLELLLGDHIFWSPVFDELSKYTYKQVSFDTMNGNLEDHKLVLAGTASSFTDIGKLILGLKQSANVKDVTFQSSGSSKVEKSGYGFSLNVTLDPKLFKK